MLRGALYRSRVAFKAFSPFGRRLATEAEAKAPAAEQAASGSSGGKQSFFRSDSWIKTVGTVGALANWTIPLAALVHIANNRDASKIDPVMTGSLIGYSLIFMRWAIAISPPNYPLFVCHAMNEVAQITQFTRYWLGKYVIAIEDDLKDAHDAEGQTDVFFNRLEVWKDKGVKWGALLDSRMAESLRTGLKDNRICTKVVQWIGEHKIPFQEIPLPPSKITDVADSLRRLLELSPQNLTAWHAGRGDLKGLSIKSWHDVYTEALEFLEKNSKEKRMPQVQELLQRLKTILDHAIEEFAFLSNESKAKAEKVIPMFRKLKDSEQRNIVVQLVFELELLMSGVGVLEGMVQALKTFDRVLLFVGVNNDHLQMLPHLLITHYQMENVCIFPPPEEDAGNDPIADRDLGAALDLFVPAGKKKGGKKKKSKAKKAGAGTGAGGADGAGVAEAETEAEAADDEE